MFPFLHLSKRGASAHKRRTWHPKAGRRKIKQLWRSRRRLGRDLKPSTERGRPMARSVSSWSSRSSLSTVSSVSTYSSESSVSYSPACPMCQPLAVLLPPGHSCVVHTSDGDVQVHAPGPWYDASSASASSVTDTESSLSTISTLSSRQPPNHRWPVLRSRPLRTFWGNHGVGQALAERGEDTAIGESTGDTQWRDSENASGTRVDNGSPKRGENESTAISPDADESISPVSVGIEHNWDR